MAIIQLSSLSGKTIQRRIDKLDRGKLVVPKSDIGDRLQNYRGYLRLLARSHLRQDRHNKLDPSDIVQQTLLEAYQQRDCFRGNDDQLAGWLRQMLVHNVTDALRALGRQRRDVRRERALQTSVDDSFSRAHDWLASDQTSPSQYAARSEQLLCMADAIEQLPEAQREAVVLYHIHGLTLAQMAEQLQRSEAAAAGLLHRGLKGLRQYMQGMGHDRG